MANKAAWLTAEKTFPFEIRDAPMPDPEPHEVVIKVHAAAINPVDAIIQRVGLLVQSYPFVLGTDMAGEVHAIGSAVDKFSVGDRVVAVCDGVMINKPTNCCFQYYCATTKALVIKLPDRFSYAQGCVLPLGLLTASRGMFDPDAMALPVPEVDQKPTGKILLVWGGASSMGSCAIQLARAAGYEVAATCSTRNFDYCRQLGAKHVFDYKNENVVHEIVEAFRGKTLGGIFDAVMYPETISSSAEIAHRMEGYKCVGTVLVPDIPLPNGLPEDVKVFKSTMCPSPCAIVPETDLSQLAVRIGPVH